jgi:hypothetical protein
MNQPTDTDWWRHRAIGSHGRKVGASSDADLEAITRTEMAPHTSLSTTN